MTDPATTIPSQFRAGDTLKWLRSLADFSAADGWILTYVLVPAAGSPQTFTAITVGADFQVNVPSTTTKDWPPGRYSAQEYVTNGTERYTIGVTQLQVLADLADSSAGLDTRTHAQKVLDAIEGWLESKAPVAHMMEIAGRKIANYSIADLLKLRDRYRNEVAAEQAAANGTSRGSRLMMRI
ncbi:MAG: hypothetical protein JSR63_07880 [Proteobacteria bacterium]|nr:hypothetical protein [Pseudomonadota bacterium]